MKSRFYTLLLLSAMISVTACSTDSLLGPDQESVFLQGDGTNQVGGDGTNQVGGDGTNQVGGDGTNQ
jgi:hypothetical protein